MARPAKARHLRHGRPGFDVIRQVRWTIVAVASVLLIGTVGFLVIGLGLVDALYTTVFTVTTVGFYEPADLGPGGKLFVTALMLGGIGTVLYTLTLLAAVFVDGHVSTLLEDRRMQRRIDAWSDHLIVCGYGRVGRAAADQLSRSGRPIVVVDLDEQRLEQCSYAYVHGDSTDDDVLRQAGVERAQVLVATLENDADSLFVTLSARALNASLLIIARARTEDAVPKFERAGADRVVNPQRLGGDRIAAFALQRHVVDFLDVAMHDADMQFRLEDFEVAPGSALAGMTVRDARQHEGGGALLLALREAGGQFVTNPPADRPISPGDAVIAIGTEAQLARLRMAGGQ